MRRTEEKKQRLPVRYEEEWGLAPWSETEWLAPGWGFFSPWQMMRRIQEDMDRVFNRFFGGWGGFEISPAPALQRWSPGVDISQTDKEWCIEAELPGVTKENIDVRVQDHRLILRAEMRPPVTEERGEDAGRRYYRQERRCGSFERVLPLPEDVKEDEITSEFRNGILTIHLPKTEQARQQGRRISIQEAEAEPAQPADRTAPEQAQARVTQPQGAAEEKEEREVAGARGL